MGTVKCPYCGHEQNIDHTDGYGYEEDQTYNQTCSCCEKVFAYQTSIHFSYDVKKCGCSNGEDHKWKLTSTFPKCASQMECTECGELRELTVEERIELGIETKEEYFKRLREEI